MRRPVPDIIESFLERGPYAVVGASTNRSKYGNRVLRSYQQRGWEVYAVNPNATEVEGLKAYPDLRSLPEVPRAISIITPPRITEKVMEEAVQLGVRFAWMQPGAESPAAVQTGENGGMELIADGSCFLVVAGFHQH